MAACKENARRRKAWICFQDESGFSLLPSVRATWAPKGQTPVLRHRFSWKRLSMSAGGRFRARRHGHLARVQHAARRLQRHLDHQVLRFLEDLHRNLGADNLTLIWDGLPSHRSKVMHAWIASQRASIGSPATATTSTPSNSSGPTSNQASLPTCAPTPSTKLQSTPNTASTASEPTPTSASPSSDTATSTYDQNVTVIYESL